MNEVINCLKQRRSIRKYQSNIIPDDLLATILDAATFAPSGRGAQSARIIMVKNQEIRNLLAKLNVQILKNHFNSALSDDYDPFFGAPYVAVVVANKNYSTHIEDGSLVMGNLMNAAASLGIGSCWIHRARETFETPEGKALLKEWGLGDEYVGIGNCILGYPETPLPIPKPRKENYIIYK